jgi:hypothetical protein
MEECDKIVLKRLILKYILGGIIFTFLFTLSTAGIYFSNIHENIPFLLFVFIVVMIVDIFLYIRPVLQDLKKGEIEKVTGVVERRYYKMASGLSPWLIKINNRENRISFWKYRKIKLGMNVEVRKAIHADVILSIREI